MSTLSRSLVLGGLIWAAASPPALARKEPEHAQTRRAAEREAALARASASLSAGDLPAASAALREATRLSPAAPPLFLLGELAQAEGRAAAAQDLMRRYLHESEPDPAGPGDQTAQVQERVRAQALLAAARGDRGEVRVAGERHAQLTLDGHLHGTLPLSLPLSLPPGTYAVSLSAAGRTVSGQVQVRAGATAEMVFQLRAGVVAVRVKTQEEADQADRAATQAQAQAQPQAPPRAPSPSSPRVAPPSPAPRAAGGRPFWRLGTGAAAGAAGLALVAVGIPALVLDGQCTQPIEAPAEVCPQLYDTRPLGLGLVLGGALLAAGGAALLAWPGPRGQVRVAPGPGLVGLTVKGAF